MKQPTFWILSMVSLVAASDECQECQNDDVPASKAGVAMLVKGNFAISATAGASVNVANNHGIESEAALINSLMKSRTAEFSDSMVKELVSMRITPEVKEFIEGTVSALEPVLNELLNQSADDKKFRDSSLASFAELDDHITQTVNSATDAGTAANTSRTKHKTCRKDQLELWNNLNACRTEQTELHGTMTTAKDVLTEKTNDLKSLLCHDDNVTNRLQARIAAAGPFKVAGQAFLDAKEAYDKKVIECNAKETAYENKKITCNSDQQSFEGDMCAVAEAISTGCESYEAGYTTRLNDYKTMSDEIVKHSKERVFEWKHLRRVECALKALAKHTVSNHEELEVEINACSSAEYPKSELVIEHKPAPARTPCPTVPAMPCQQKFLSEEYGSLQDGAKATQCLPCAPPPASSSMEPAAAFDAKACVHTNARVFDLRGMHATEAACKAKCIEQENCELFSGVFNSWCIGCDSVDHFTLVNSATPNAKAFKKAI